MSKLVKIILGMAGALVLVLGISGYLWYRSTTGDSAAVLQRQRESILPAQGPAVPPNQKTGSR